jgi:hypothetical protein
MDIPAYEPGAGESKKRQDKVRKLLMEERLCRLHRVLGLSVCPAWLPGRIPRDYQRRDALTLRRQLMQKWADFVDQPWQDGANVIRIGAA